jgi:hypothetical protein
MLAKLETGDVVFFEPRQLPTGFSSRTQLPGTSAEIVAHVEWRTADQSINQTGCDHAAISCFTLHGPRTLPPTMYFAPNAVGTGLLTAKFLWPIDGPCPSCSLRN